MEPRITSYKDVDSSQISLHMLYDISDKREAREYRDLLGSNGLQKSNWRV